MGRLLPSDAKGYNPMSNSDVCIRRRVTLDDEFDSNGCDFDGRRFRPFLDEVSSYYQVDTEFDIIFVHGSSGDEISTWKCDDMFWPQELLKTHPHARVFLFGYDSHVLFQSDFVAFTKTADYLLHLVHKSRLYDRADRPLIWVAHSLGGCLVKAAYITAKVDESIHHSSYTSTLAMLFFSTPHRARSITGWYHIMDHVVGVSRAYDDDIPPLGQTFSHREAFLRLLVSFETSLSAFKPRLFSFYERHESFGNDIPLLVTSPDNAIFHPLENVQCLDGNHVTICRLESTNSPSYISIKEAIQDALSSKNKEHLFYSFRGIPRSELEDDLHEAFNSKTTDLQTSASDAEISRLVTDSIYLDFVPIVKLRRTLRLLGAGTCRHFWEPPDFDLIDAKQTSNQFTETTEFRQWHDTPGLTLVITDHLGHGKSTRAREIVRCLENKIQPIILSCFVTSLHQSTPTILQIIQHLLLQILEIYPLLVRHFSTTQVFSERGESGTHMSLPDATEDLSSSFFSTQELSETLVSILNDDLIGDVTFVLGDVDESEELTAFLKTIRNVSTTKLRVAIYYPDSTQSIHEDFNVQVITLNSEFNIVPNESRAEQPREFLVDRRRFQDGEDDGDASGPIDSQIDKGLELAVLDAQTLVVEDILKQGPSNSAKDRSLHIAASMGSLEIVQQLLKSGASRFAENEDGMKPIHLAAQRGYRQILEFLFSFIGTEDREGRSPLFMACEGVSKASIYFLLRCGININLQDNAGRTPLHIATATGSMDVLSLLLAKGADYNAEDNRGMTPLHVAALAGWRTAVTELLKAGASVNHPDENGHTTLHFACKSPNPSLETIQMLLANSADPDFQNLEGRSALHVAAQRGSVATISLLLEMVSPGSRRYAKDKSGNTPLDLARSNMNTAVLQLLQARQLKADFNTERVSLILSQLHDRTDIDVVFVNAFPMGALMEKDLRNILPKTIQQYIPTARVIDWHYDAGISELPRTNMLNRLAISLLTDLSALKQGIVAENDRTQQQEPDPPLVFIGHSLSGLVIKAAIIQGARNDQWKHIFRKTRAIIFLGTPHRGGLHESLSRIIDRIAEIAWARRSIKRSMPFIRPQRMIRQSMRGNTESSALASMQSDFLSFSTEMRILTIAETRATGNDLLVPREVANIESFNAKNIAVDTDHFTLPTILDEDTSGISIHVQNLLYDVVSGRLWGHSPKPAPDRPLISESPNKVNRLRRLSHQEFGVLHALRPSTSSFDFLKSADENGYVTSSLLKPNPELQEYPFRNWADNKHSGLLWITGKPGCGKSVLMKQLYDDKVIVRGICFASQIKESNLVKADYTFDSRNHGHSTITHMLRSLLHQVFTTRPSLLAEALLPYYSDEGISDHQEADTRRNRMALYNGLKDIISASRNTLFYFFVDGLDQCNVGSPDELPEDCQEEAAYMLMSLANENSNHVKICVSSRMFPVFLDLFSTAETLVLHDHNTQDITNFVRTQMELRGVPHDTRNWLERHIIENSHGLFIWVHLVLLETIRSLRYRESDTTLRRVLDTIPTRLGGIYNALLQDIPKRYHLEAQRVFSMMLLSRQPVHPIILSVALSEYSVTNDHNKCRNSAAKSQISVPGLFKPESVREMSLRIISRCGSLVVAGASGDVEFIHPSLLEFLPQHLLGMADPKTKEAWMEPSLALLTGSIALLKRRSEPYEDVEGHIGRAFSFSKLADNDSNVKTSNMSLFDDLCTVCLELYESRDNREVLEVENRSDPSNPPQAGLDLKFYPLVVALKHGLMRYIQDQLDRFETIPSSVSLLSIGLTFYDHNSLPWARTMPLLNDLPDPMIISSLIYRREPKGRNMRPDKDSWRKVLECGYHCFSQRVPVGTGPRNTKINCWRWITIFTTFIEAGANPLSSFKVEFRSRGENSDGGSHGPADIEVKTITPSTTIDDNLAGRPEYEENYAKLREMLVKAKAQARSSIMNSLKLFTLPRERYRQISSI